MRPSPRWCLLAHNNRSKARKTSDQYKAKRYYHQEVKTTDREIAEEKQYKKMILKQIQASKESVGRIWQSVVKWLAHTQLLHKHRRTPKDTSNKSALPNASDQRHLAHFGGTTASRTKVHTTRAFTPRAWIVGQGIKLIWRSRFWTALLGISTILVGSLVVIVGLAHTQLEAISQRIRNNLTVVATIKQDRKTWGSVIPAEQVAAQIEGMPHVLAVRIVSEEEMRDRFLRNVAKVNTKPSAKIFPEALEVTVDEPESMAAVQKRIREVNGVESATYIKELVDRITALARYISRVASYGTLAIGLLAIGLAFVIARSAVFDQRKNVAIMDQIGASKLYISLPIMTHLLIVSSIGSLVSLFIGQEIAASLLAARATGLPSWLMVENVSVLSSKPALLGALILPLVVGLIAVLSCLITLRSLVQGQADYHVECRLIAKILRITRLRT